MLTGCYHSCSKCRCLYQRAGWYAEWTLTHSQWLTDAAVELICFYILLTYPIFTKMMNESNKTSTLSWVLYLYWPASVQSKFHQTHFSCRLMFFDSSRNFLIFHSLLCFADTQADSRCPADIFSLRVLLHAPGGCGLGCRAASRAGGRRACTVWAHIHEEDSGKSMLSSGGLRGAQLD